MTRAREPYSTMLGKAHTIDDYNDQDEYRYSRAIPSRTFVPGEPPVDPNRPKPPNLQKPPRSRTLGIILKTQNNGIFVEEETLRFTVNQAIEMQDHNDQEVSRDATRLLNILLPYISEEDEKKWHSEPAGLKFERMQGFLRKERCKQERLQNQETPAIKQTEYHNYEDDTHIPELASGDYKSYQHDPSDDCPSQYQSSTRSYSRGEMHQYSQSKDVPFQAERVQNVRNDSSKHHKKERSPFVNTTTGHNHHCYGADRVDVVWEEEDTTNASSRGKHDRRRDARGKSSTSKHKTHYRAGHDVETRRAERQSSSTSAKQHRS